MFREERGGEDEDIMQTRKENEEKYSVYFWRQKKKRLSDAITQEVEEDPREEGVSGSRSRSSVSCDAKRLRTRMT